MTTLTYLYVQANCSHFTLWNKPHFDGLTVSGRFFNLQHQYKDDIYQDVLHVGKLKPT